MQSNVYLITVHKNAFYIDSTCFYDIAINKHNAITGTITLIHINPLTVFKGSNSTVQLIYSFRIILLNLTVHYVTSVNLTLVYLYISLGTIYLQECKDLFLKGGHLKQQCNEECLPLPVASALTFIYVTLPKSLYSA